MARRLTDRAIGRFWTSAPTRVRQPQARGGAGLFHITRILTSLTVTVRHEIRVPGIHDERHDRHMMFPRSHRGPHPISFFGYSFTNEYKNAATHVRTVRRRARARARPRARAYADAWLRR